MPGRAAPERVVFEELKAKQWQHLPERFGIGAGDLIGYLEDAMLDPDHHQWPKRVGDRLLRSKASVWETLCIEWVKSCATPSEKEHLIMEFGTHFHSECGVLMSHECRSQGQKRIVSIPLTEIAKPEPSRLFNQRNCTRWRSILSWSLTARMAPRLDKRISDQRNDSQTRIKGRRHDAKVLTRAGCATGCLLGLHQPQVLNMACNNSHPNDSARSATACRDG